MKNKKGITLVALIITIIVMLILAGVAISMTVGNNGVIQRAQTAKQEQEKASLQDIIIASYVFKTPASDSTIGTLDLPKTGLAMYQNLTTNGFTVNKYDDTTDENGNAVKRVKLDEANQKIEVDVEGKYGNYIGTVEKRGLVSGLEIIGKDEEDDVIPGDTTQEPSIEYAEVPEELYKYVMGESGTGRDFFEIYDPDNEIFIPEKSTIADADTSVISTALTDEDENGDAYAYIRYNGKNIYKIKVEMTNFETISIVTAFVEEDSNLLGKYVKYDGKLWVILYNDNVNGVQMITAETLEANNIKLGNIDNQINWNDEMVINKANIFETDNPSETERLSDVEKSIYSYNNAIVTLNNKCASLIYDKSAIQTDEFGNYKIRSVGSNPINPNDENSTLYTSDNLKNRPNNNEKYSVGTFDKLAKATDTNYISDYENMMNMGINGTGEDYWLASRLSREDIWHGEEFRILAMMGDGHLWKSDGDAYAMLLAVDDSVVWGMGWDAGVRPIITLKDNVLDNVTGSGTELNPFILK